MNELVPPDDLPDGLVPADDLPEPAGKQISKWDAATRGLERGLWSLPALVTGGALTAENFEAGVNFAKDRLSGGERPFSEFQQEQKEWSRAGEQQHPWTTGLTRGVGQAPGDALLAVAAGGPLGKFLAARATDSSLKARQVANAVTQSARQFGTGVATSAAPTVAGQVTEGIGSGLTAGGLGYLAPAPLTPLVEEMSGLSQRAGKQAVKAHRATDTDLGNLQNKHGAGQVGDEAIAGLKVLEQKTPDGRPVLPFFGNKEQLAKNWDEVAAHSGRGKAATVEAVDEARPEGAVNVGNIVERARADALPETTSDDVYVNYSDAPADAAKGYLERFIQRYGLGKQPLSKMEDYKSGTQRYVNATGSAKNPVRPRQAIDNDPDLRFRRTVSGIAKEENESVVEEVLGAEAAAKFKADKEAYGLAEDFGRYAHNAYNRGEAKPGMPGMAHKWDLIRRAEEAVGRTHAPRAHIYKGLDDTLSGSNPVAGSHALNSGSLRSTPGAVAARSPNPILDYLRSRGLIE